MKIDHFKTILYVILFILFCNSSCRYEEGPLISFIRAKYRVTGNYRLTKFYVNNIDTTNYYNGLLCNSGFSFNIQNSEEAGDINPYLPTYINPCPFNFSGKWKLSDNCNILQTGLCFNMPILGPWGQPDTFDWNIIKLTDNEMYLGGKSFNTTYRLEFKKI
jgi:hypothetical protein